MVGDVQIQAVNLGAELLDVHRIVAFPSQAPVGTRPFPHVVDDLIVADTCHEGLCDLLVIKAVLLCLTIQIQRADIDIVVGTGIEVNPESWTQLKGSNETEF